jgi:hypothetical protein
MTPEKDRYGREADVATSWPKPDRPLWSAQRQQVTFVHEDRRRQPSTPFLSIGDEHFVAEAEAEPTTGRLQDAEVMFYTSRGDRLGEGSAKRHVSSYRASVTHRTRCYAAACHPHGI